MNELEQEVLAELGERQYVEFLADIRKITRLRLKNLGFNKTNEKEFKIKYELIKAEIMWQVHERINQIRENYEGTIKFEEGIVKIENYKGTIRYERLLEETIEELAAFPTY